MCNKGFQCFLSESENLINHPHPPQQQQLHYNFMDSPTVAQSPPASSLNDDSRRVKFLCSFLGSIMPRPQDGKLRYVGGETRIVSVPRDVSYEELMGRMRELYEGAAVLKYQQPDEDLDALVSVVNDDDVVNMMEEYDKLGSGDGFTRLRIFLFSQFEQDGSSHFIDGEDTERRYVDALNSLNDDFGRKLQQSEFSMMSPVEDIHVPEQFFSPLSVESGMLGHRNGELSMSQYNLHQLAMQQQQQQSMGQRYNEMDAPWNPSYFSPRHHALHDSRSLVEYPSSPTGTRYRVQFPEMPDKSIDRVQEEYARIHVSQHPIYDNQQQYSENVVWMPTGEKSGFPGNILHGAHVMDGNSRYGQPHPCAECQSNRDNFAVNADAKFHPGIYPNEDSRGHASGSGRVNDHYGGDVPVPVPVTNFSIGHGSVSDGHNLSSNYIHQRAGPELGAELFPDQTAAAIPHLKLPSLEEHGMQYSNPSSSFGTDNHYAVPRGHVPGHPFWRNTPTPVHIGPSYEATAPPNGIINAGLIRGEGSPGFFIGSDGQNAWVDPSQKLSGHDGLDIPEHPSAQAQKHPLPVDSLHPPQDKNSGIYTEHVQLLKSPLNMVLNQEVLRNDTHMTEAMSLLSRSLREGKEEKSEDIVEKCAAHMQKISFAVQNKTSENVSGAANPVESNNSNAKPAEEVANVEKLSNKDPPVPEDSKDLVDQFSFLPELMASVKKAALEVAEEVKTTGCMNPDSQIQNSPPNEDTTNEVEPVNAHGDLELDAEIDHVDTSKIEPTEAEEEAIARGLQTIKNDDLEEIRELGSGTYGAVYHGKWKGSDVAIKRIKASCFAGRPSERARLIADFWKEALMLSSLHHPNVVSFYGIVRDGPDGSLATVTEFMVNGSLKQFLHKKDRTIDRRKRLIIAMDAAFGMEYLHGKNIVHFDLKCENLLVNMRDPQRPVCKIGDLGLSKVKQHTLVSGGVRGTLPWMAPELLSGKSNMVSEKIDVYSFGIVMWELLTGNEPYADMHCASIIVSCFCFVGGIVNNTLRPQIPTWCDPEWKSLMESCWASDPAERPSFSEISKKLRSMAAAMNVK
ncbi:uncharacterized protein [Arachis hypogaea]|uniref:uncharacterized protein isoform X1 n=2 Tax=Arachis hypogaea TaxID=3818 RepID=UPI000DECC8FB|nr:uncharacterized protein LOC112698510 isoform X1 [Arachis hypogaea]XP_025607430.1 uncharacterized protein LOC112698510 isoform X1 [Arachis hypogaea]